MAKNILALDVPGKLIIYPLLSNMIEKVLFTYLIRYHLLFSVEKGKLRLKFPFSDLKSNCLVLMQEKNDLAEDLPRKSKIYIPGPVSSFKTIELRFFDVLLKGNHDFELLRGTPKT